MKPQSRFITSRSENGRARLLPNREPWKKSGLAGASSSQRRRHRGSGLVIALVTLLVVTSIMGSIMHALLTELRQTRQTAIEVQAQWLADAAVERAAVRLAANSSYAGETWNVDLPASSSGAESHGVVEIKIERGDGEKRAQIIVHANYPDDSRRRVAAERTVSIPSDKNNSDVSRESDPARRAGPTGDLRKETNE